MAVSRKRRVSDLDPPLPRRRILVIEPEPEEPAIPLPTRIPTYGQPRRGTMEVRTGELEGFAPPPLDTRGNVLRYPTRNMAPAAVEEPELPLELPTYTPPASTITEEDPFLPTRARRVHPPGTIEYEKKALEDLQSAPLKKLSRKQAAKEGFLRGLQVGGLAGGIVGAATGAITPGRTAKLGREIEIARASGKVDRVMKQEGEEAQIENYRALTAQRLNKPDEDAATAAAAARKERIARLLVMHGRAGRYNPNDPNDAASQAIKREADMLGVSDQLVPYTKAEKVPPRVTVDDTTFERQDNGDWRPAAGLPRRQMVDVPGYGKMTPAQARIADATADDRRYRRQRDETEDERRARERQEENSRKRSTYGSEATEWAEKEKNFRANKDAEDRTIRAKEEKIEALYREKPAGYFGGGRSADDIKIDIARVLKDLESHRQKSGRFQTEADQAAGKATEARRNAGLYSGDAAPRGLPTRSTTRAGKGGVRPKVSRRKLGELLGVP